MKNIVAGGRVHVAVGSESLISSSGLSLLAQTASVSGLSEAISDGLFKWRKPTAVHDPGKVVLDLVLAIAAGGDCLAHVSLVRAQPELFGQVAPDPTISRLIDALGDDPAAAVAAVRRPARQRGRRSEATAAHSPTITRWSLIWTRL